jgi:hypothetical protein
MFGRTIDRRHKVLSPTIVAPLFVATIDLVLTYQQRVGKRNLYLMESIRKRDGRPFTGLSVNKLKESHEVTRLAKERA